ncbi:hypothetical protein APY03_0391 [Variovorax sp. WDL1]|nr:hypothetical protein APY03_0391 [Variovorax sp. WDL1]
MGPPASALTRGARPKKQSRCRAAASAGQGEALQVVMR